jgi:ankyrin repeat protein
LCKALKLPERIALQYCHIHRNDIDFIYIDTQFKPNSFKFILKNKIFQIKADSYDKTCVALKTFDLDFAKTYIEEFESDLNDAFYQSVRIGFTDAVTFLLSDPRVDPSAENNRAVRLAAVKGHVEIVRLLISDARVDPSAENNLALRRAISKGHVEIVKVLISDPRVNSSENNVLIEAVENGNLEIVKLLLSYPCAATLERKDYALRNKEHVEILKLVSNTNLALIYAAKYGHVEIVKFILSDPTLDPSAKMIHDALYYAKKEGHLEVVNFLETRRS